MMLNQYGGTAGSVEPATGDVFVIWDASQARVRNVSHAHMVSTYGPLQDFARWQRTSSFSMTANVWTDIPYNAKTAAQEAGALAALTPGTSMTIPTTGWYEVTFSCEVVPTSGTRTISAQITIDGVAPDYVNGASLVTALLKTVYSSGPIYLSSGAVLRTQVKCEAVGAFAAFSTPGWLSVRRVA